MTERRAFRAMGTTVELLLEADDVDAPFDAAEAEFERLEQIMSRFRPDSELSQLNELGSLDASADLLDVVERALEARLRTGGRFDPTVHDAVVATGYDRTFAEVAEESPDEAGSAACGGRVTVDRNRIEIEPGFRLDLGGIGKGFAAERVAQQLALSGPCLVNAGGDIAVRGVPEEGYWPVGIEDGPTIGLARAGLATSGRDRRRWRRGGREVHHLIDPRTGTSAATDLVRVTAVAADAVEAEVLAKVLLLDGEQAALCSGVPAVLVTSDGRTVLAGGIG